jgi:flagellar biosynthesis/type III secretory pathway protein FliH
MPYKAIFARDFDQEEAEARSAALACEDQRRWSRAEMEAELQHARAEARAEAWQEGFAAGQTQTRAEREEAFSAAGQALVTVLAEINQAHSDHAARLEHDIVEFLGAAFAKMAPELSHRTAKQRLSDEIDRIARMAAGSSHLEIRLHPETANALESYLVPAQNFITLRKDPQLLPHQIEAQWDGGRFSRNLDSTTAQILALLTGPVSDVNLSERNQNG